MMMKLLAYLALISWLVLGWKYWTDYKTCDTAAVAGASTKNECPICFNWSSPNPELCDNWTETRDSILANIPDGSSLIIKTKYNPLESDDNELGRNRAVSIKALFNGLLEESRILLRTTEVEDAKHTNCQSKSELSYSSDSETITQEENQATLHLENKSIAANPAVRDYLDNLANRVKQSNEKIMIAGHTDSDGSEVSNLKLGYKKADEVKAYLILLGVSKDNLITISKGENEPLDNNTNATSEEKAANRRIEIKIINS